RLARITRSFDPEITNRSPASFVTSRGPSTRKRMVSKATVFDSGEPGVTRDSPPASEDRRNGAQMHLPERWSQPMGWRYTIRPTLGVGPSAGDEAGHRI